MIVYEVSVIQCPIETLNFHDDGCSYKGDSSDLYMELGIFKGETAASDAYNAACGYLEKHYKGLWRPNQFGDNPSESNPYQFNWINARIGIIPASISKVDTSKIQII